MTSRSELLERLRRRFCDGATPSRLIRDIVSVLGEQTSSADVRAVLSEAFQLPVVRLGPALESALGGKQRVILNRTLLAQIVENTEQWNGAGRAADHSCWLSEVTLADPVDVKAQVSNAPYPGLSAQSWAALSADERESLHVQLASSIVLSERVELLAKLAERLQEKLDDLEDKAPPPAGMR